MCRIVARPPMRSRITPTNAWSRTAPWTKPITHQNAWPGPRRTIQVTRPHSVTRPNAPTIAEPATRCRARTRASEVLARRPLGVLGRLARLAGHLPRAELAAPHLLEGRLGLHVLGPQRGLDAVEQSLEPAEKLRLGNAYLRLAARVDDLGAGPRLIAHADSLPGAPLNDRSGHRCGRGGHHHDHQDRGPEQQRHDCRGDPDQALVEDEVPPGGQD